MIRYSYNEKGNLMMNDDGVETEITRAHISHGTKYWDFPSMNSDGAKMIADSKVRKMLSLPNIVYETTPRQKSVEKEMTGLDYCRYLDNDEQKAQFMELFTIINNKMMKEKADKARQAAIDKKRAEIEKLQRELAELNGDE